MSGQLEIVWASVPPGSGVELAGITTGTFSQKHTQDMFIERKLDVVYDGKMWDIEYDKLCNSLDQDTKARHEYGALLETASTGKILNEQVAFAWRGRGTACGMWRRRPDRQRNQCACGRELVSPRLGACADDDDCPA